MGAKTSETSPRIEDLIAENLRLREALEKHDAWHQNIGTVSFNDDDDDDDVTELDLSAEYADSSLYAETSAALSAPALEVKLEYRVNFVGGPYAQWICKTFVEANEELARIFPYLKPFLEARTPAGEWKRVEVA